MSGEPADGERLRQAFAALADDGSGEVDTGKVDSERIWLAVAGEASLEERHAVIEEVARNPAAAEAWRLAHALQQELGQAAARPQRRRWSWRPLLAAAIVVLAVGLGLWQGLDLGRPAEPVYRANPETEIRALTEDGSSLPRQDFVLRFTGAGEGARYRVRVLTSELAVLADASDLTTTEFRISEDELMGIPAGTRLLWQVEARRPDGRLVTSPTFFVELR